jgi:hypothetical protein
MNVFGKTMNAIFFCLTLMILTNDIRAAENGPNQPPKKAPQSDDNTSNKSNHARWSADPERGWIRSEERSDPRKKSEGNPKEDENKQRGSLWDY